MSVCSSWQSYGHWTVHMTESWGSSLFIQISLPVPGQRRCSVFSKFINHYSLSIFIFLKQSVILPPEDVINALLPFGCFNHHSLKQIHLTMTSRCRSQSSRDIPVPWAKENAMISVSWPTLTKLISSCVEYQLCIKHCQTHAEVPNTGRTQALLWLSQVSAHEEYKQVNLQSSSFPGPSGPLPRIST